MFNKFLQEQKGQTLAEFAVVLVVLMILFVWTFQFYDMFAIKHKTLEASRYAAWETAYGHSNVTANAQSIIQNAQTIINTPAGVQVNVSPSSSIVGTSFYFSSLGALRIWQMGANRNTFLTTTASANYGLRYTAGAANTLVRSRYALIYDSWDIMSLQGGHSNGDVENVVANMFYVIPGLGSFLNDVFNFINNLNWIASFLGQSWDINPMGHVDLRNVPPPE